MLRLHFPTGDLIIDHRSTLSTVRDLECLESEDEVRRLLLLALNDPAALDRLRRFFAQWNSEAWRVNVIKDRRLIERVARMTVNGPLAAFVVYYKPALNTSHLATKLAIGHPAMKADAAGGPQAAAHTATAAPTAVGPAPEAATRLEMSSPAAATQRALSSYHVTSLPTELRFAEVLRRTPPYLPHALRGDFAKLMNSDLRVTVVGVLSIWSEAHTLGTIFIVDSLLTLTHIRLRGSDLSSATETLNLAINHTLEAREERDLQEAAEKLADVVATFGVEAFTAMILHGATRIVASNMPAKRPEREPPVAWEPPRPAPEPSNPPDPLPADKDIPAECAFLKKGHLVSGTKSQFDRSRKEAKLGPGTPIKHTFPGDTKPSDATQHEVEVDGHKVKVIVPATYPKDKNLPDAAQIAKGLGAVPPGQLATIKQVVVSPNANPSDAYWAKKYNKPNFKSAATGGAGGVTTYPTTNKLAQERIDSNLIHEGGHTYQQELWKDAEKKKQWKEAIASDPRSPSRYADSSIEEDFSESMVMYSLSKGTKCEALAKKMFPARYKLMDEMMKKK